jgi:predicted patatin/cPLA2 family phospholipase
MEDSVLSDFIDDEGQKLLYVFDYMTERAFFIEMKELITGKTLKDPVCTYSLGQAPPEFVDMDEFDAKIDAKAAAAAAAAVEDMDEDFYGRDEFNEDEFDAEGFDEMSFD